MENKYYVLASVQVSAMKDEICNLTSSRDVSKILEGYLNYPTPEHILVTPDYPYWDKVKEIVKKHTDDALRDEFERWYVENFKTKVNLTTLRIRRDGDVYKQYICDDEDKDQCKGDKREEWRVCYAQVTSSWHTYRKLKTGS